MTKERLASGMLFQRATGFTQAYLNGKLDHAIYMKLSSSWLVVAARCLRSSKVCTASSTVVWPSLESHGASAPDVARQSNEIPPFDFTTNEAIVKLRLATFVIRSTGIHQASLGRYDLEGDRCWLGSALMGSVQEELDGRVSPQLMDHLLNAYENHLRGLRLTLHASASDSV